MPRWTMVLLVALAMLAGCGDDDGETRPGTAQTTATAAQPDLAMRPARSGEIIVTGEGSPMTHGPHEFDGRYLVRFEQYAPENAELDFTAQTPLTASLTPREGDPRGAIELFQGASATGRRQLKISGSLYVDVSFGDFPYVLRFTPRPG